MKPLPPFTRCQWNGVNAYLTCTLVSIALFALFFSIDDIINDDGIEYVFAAHSYVQSDLATALTFRPELTFFSQIAWLSKITGLSLPASSYALSLFWQILLTCGFVAVVRALGATTNEQILAIVVIASVASLNHLRPHIIKGFGFWACQLWALWALLGFVNSRRWPLLLLWLGLSALAIFYRVEGFAYVVGIGLILPFLLSGSARNQYTAIVLIALLSSFGVLLLAGNSLENTGTRFSPLHILNTEIDRLKQLSAGLNSLKEDIRTNMPNKWARQTASDLVIGGLLLHTVKTLFWASHGVLLVVLLAHRRAKLRWRQPETQVIAAYVIIGLLISLYVVASRFFVDQRYVFLPALILCVPLPFLISRLFNSATPSTPGSRITKWAVVMIVAINVLKPIFDDDDAKNYIKEAGEWVRHHLPRAASIYYNDKKIAYYAGNYDNQSFRDPRPLSEILAAPAFAYIVIHDTHANPGQQSVVGNATKLGDFTLIRSFQNFQGKKVAIYQAPTGPP